MSARYAMTSFSGAPSMSCVATTRRWSPPSVASPDHNRRAIVLQVPKKRARSEKAKVSLADALFGRTKHAFSDWCSANLNGASERWS